MRIIKEGALAAEALYEHTCTACGTKYEFKRKESRFSGDQRDGNVLVTNCPMKGCGVTNYTSPRGSGGHQWDR